MPKAAPIIAAVFAAWLLAGCVTGEADGDRKALTAGESYAAGSSLSRDPAQLIGAPPERLLAALGEPRAQRREQPAEVWQYRGRDCVLDVFFYAAAADSKKVVHLEARDAAAHETAVAPCLTGVLRDRVAS